MPGKAVPRDGDRMQEHRIDRGARILVVCVPATGHLTPLLPLARAFAAAGDDVVVASGPDVEGAVTAAGLEFRPVCPGFGDWYATLARRTPGPPGEGLAPERVERYFVPRLFGEVGLAAMRDGLSGLVAEFGPDLVVFEQHALAAPLVAAAHGVPAVLHMIGLHSDPLVLELTSDAVTPAWREAGLPAPPTAGLYQGTTLGIYPPSLDPPPPGIAVEPLRPAPLPDPALALPVALRQPDRPLVYVTLGTSFADEALFALILRALADLPVTVLVTVGRGGAMPAEVPDNAVVTDFVPQAAVLPHCAAVVHHAGAGTAFGVLAHGLPSVALPRGADNFSIAARMARAGAARSVGPDEVGAAAVREAVRAVLGDPSFRRDARRIADEIAAMPAPADVVPLLRRQAGAAIPAREALR
jgi:UDP:flavonoid glycosyltransferase YjiC (YdhE family)